MEDRNVGGKVLALRSKSVDNPGAHGRAAGLDHSGVEIPDRLFVIAVNRNHGANHGNVIDVRPKIRQQLGQLHPALAVFGKLEGSHPTCAHALGVNRFHEIGARLLSVVLAQRRFRIEQVHVTRPAILEQQDYTFRLRGKVRLLSQDVKLRLAFGRHRLIQQGRQGDTAQARPYLIEKASPAKHAPDWRVRDVSFSRHIQTHWH